MAENNGIQNQTRISFRKKLSLIIFGLLISFVLLEAGLRLGGFIISSLQEDRNQASLKQKASYRIMCLGESTTAMGGRYSYPSQLEMVLNERDEGMKFSVINKGIPATDSSMILLLLNDNLAKYKPDMVIVMMGINDKEKQFSKEYRSTLKFFLKSFKTYNLMRLLQFNIMAKIQELCYFWLKNKYFYQEKYGRDEKTFIKVTEEKPKGDEAYIELGKLYASQERLSSAEEAFKKALEINPENESGYIRLGWVYGCQGKNVEKEEIFKKADEVLEKATKADPRNSGARDEYVQFGIDLEYSRKLSLAERVFNKILEKDSGISAVCLHLGNCYFFQGRYTLAEEMYNKAIELSYKNSEAYKALAMLCYQIGKQQLAKESLRKAEELNPAYYYSITRSNYFKLKKILDQKKIKLVCVQYPVRSARPLRKIFVFQRNVIIVDNERVFKEVIEKAGYREYFEDMFGGDFGHCTPKGSRLLAENIANSILKEMFRK